MEKIFAALDMHFPHAECALQHENAFQLLVATILSAQCTDERVNKVTPELFRKYPTPQDFVGLPQDELEREIHSTGFFRNKAKSIIGAATRIAQEFGIHSIPVIWLVDRQSRLRYLSEPADLDGRIEALLKEP